MKVDEICSICEGPLKADGVYYDAKIPIFGGSWGWVCKACFRLHGLTLGLGKGQEFDSKTDKKLRG